MNEANSKVVIKKGDITTLPVDAIVNAANSSLLGGGGVDGAIHRAGGSVILEECKKIIARQGGCEVGQAVITSAGNMPSDYVIHTVGPVWHGGGNNEEIRLSECYRNSLQLALEHNCRTIAFPNISTGVYGFPKDKAARIAIETVSTFLTENHQFEQVIMICFDHENYELLQKHLHDITAK